MMAHSALKNLQNGNVLLPTVREEAPLKFSLTSFAQSGVYSEEDYLNCEACRLEAQILGKRLFNEQV